MDILKIRQSVQINSKSKQGYIFVYFYSLDVPEVAVPHRYDLGYAMAQIIAIIEQDLGTDLRLHFDLDRGQDR